MGFLSEKDKKAVQQRLEDLVNPVKIIYFTQELECTYCRETRTLLQELAELNSKIEYQVFNFQTDKKIAEQYGIDKIPATVIAGDKDYGIRFYGIPSGYEFASLLEAVLMVSKGKTELSEATRKQLSAIDKAVHIQVFVTPTCPYCPQAVKLAHQFALENDNIKAEMVEAIEFPHLAQRYRVMGVPRTVINENTFLEGAAPEKMLLEKLNQALV